MAIITFPILPTSLMNHTFSVDVKHHETKKLLLFIRAQELCEHGGGPGLALIPCPILPPYLIHHTVSVDVKHHERRSYG